MSKVDDLDLSGLREQYGLTVFVETGCELGNGIDAALRYGFEQVFSCDIRAEAVRHCRERFLDKRKVCLYRDTSLSALRRICQRLSARVPVPRCFFWLDAHYPAFYGAPETGMQRFPLFRELQAIMRTK